MVECELGWWLLVTHPDSWLAHKSLSYKEKEQRIWKNTALKLLINKDVLCVWKVVTSYTLLMPKIYGKVKPEHSWGRFVTHPCRRANTLVMNGFVDIKDQEGLRVCLRSETP